MRIKRKICQEEIEGDMYKEREITEDKLTNLPQELQLRIFSCLDDKDAVKISLLSKTSVSLWTWIPLLEFNYSVFKNLYVFDKFVNRVLRLRDRSAKLDQLTFTRGGISSAKILKNVFEYAFSHGVKKLEAYITNSRNHTWPVCMCNSFESLTSLKLQSEISMSCPFLGSRSGSFKNLTDLYLKSAIITNLDPFSGFPVLERLTLVNCYFRTEGETLSVHARNLSNLTISGYQNLKSCELTTPRLKFFEYQGPDFPNFRTNEGQPVLDTMVIGYNVVSYRMQEKRMFEDLLSLFCALPNAKSLMLFSSIVYILSLFQDQLVKRSSPFRELKCLKLDFRYQNCFDRPWPSESFGIPSNVKAYFLQNCPDAKVTMIYPECKTHVHVEDI